ncbi:MAG: metal ABC transporter permease [Alphaproteobacteria bacterium]|nr:metal ABC transporter permease [Alphaproteobacteria bacterium]
MDAWLILLPAFALSVLLVLTHTYLGLHVLARGIIFVDLALAQVAALGASLAFLLGQDPHGLDAHLYALGATLAAAFGFAKLRRLPGKTMREVVIGCVYVVATALSIVVLSRSASGLDELKSMLNGSILWARWEEIALIGGVYLVLVALHAVWRRRFHALSLAPVEAGEGAAEGAAEAPGFLWEFLFFASFAVVITLAVNLAGVLLVFAFLIIPAFSASLLARTFGARLALGWAIGVVGSLAGLWVSYNADLPVGATMVSVLGALPIVAALIAALARARRRAATP